MDRKFLDKLGKYKKHIIIFIGIVMITIIVYINAFNSSMEKAISLYNKEEYSKAWYEIDNYFNITGNKDYIKIRILGKSTIGYSYCLAKDNIEKSKNYGDEDFVSACYDYVMVIYSAKEELKTCKNPIEKETLQEILNKTYNNLQSLIGVTREEAENIQSGIDVKKYIEKYKDKRTTSSSSSYTSEISLSDVKMNKTYKSSYIEATGTVKNTGTKTATYIKVKVQFLDSRGNVIDTNWTYAVASEGLAYGETKKWDTSVEYDSRITEIKASIMEYK